MEREKAQLRRQEAEDDEQRAVHLSARRRLHAAPLASISSVRQIGTVIVWGASEFVYPGDIMLRARPKLPLTGPDVGIAIEGRVGRDCGRRLRV